MHNSNSKIAVVGNAESLFDYDYGELIDSHDIVYRFNQGCNIVNPGKQGSRTDICCLNSWTNFSQEFRQKIKATKTIHVSPKNRHGCPFEMVDIQEIEKLKTVLTVDRPSAGTMVLWSLRKYEVSIFGFDFKKTNTYYYGRVPNEVHDYRKEKEFISRLLEENKWKMYPGMPA